MTASRDDVAAVCRRIRSEREVALAVHTKPDPDALGAAAGMLDLFAQLDVTARLYVDAVEILPLVDLLLPSERVERTVPPSGLPLYALDCARFERIALPIQTWSAPVVNIDHHHDNPGYGDTVLVRGAASSTCEIICEIAQGLGLQPSLQAATALYAGISFDSGHFHHQSTSAHTFACAAWLRDLGVDVTAVYGRLYERRTLGALRLWARAVEAAQPVLGGRALVAVLRGSDYAATGASPSEAEGVVESLRSVEGVEVAALVKEEPVAGGVRVSLRSRALDVSEVAALEGGGGHRLAAGFSAARSPEEVTSWLSSELERRLSTASC